MQGNTPNRTPNRIDTIVGQNIRFQRTQKGMSQEALANRLGITFQQVQKYEKGTNRTSASRLVNLASILEIGVTELFDGIIDINDSNDLTLTKLLQTPDATKLLQVFNAVKNKKIRATIIDLVFQIAASQTGD